MTDSEDLLRRALGGGWHCRTDALECVAMEGGRRCYRVASDRGELSATVYPLDAHFEDVLQGLRVQQYAAEHGITTSVAFPTIGVEPCERLEGYGVVVQPWLDGRAFRARPIGVKAVGELVGHLHVLAIPRQLEASFARLEPRRTLEGVRDELAQAGTEVPASYRAQMEVFCETALELDDFPSVPRSLIHTDLAWSNIIELDEGHVALIDFEGAGVGPPIIDLVEVTTYLTLGPSGSGSLREEQAQAFYDGYRKQRRLTAEELDAFPEAHLFHQVYHLANALGRGDYGFIDRMAARLASWQGGVLDRLIEIAAA